MCVPGVPLLLRVSTRGPATFAGRTPTLWGRRARERRHAGKARQTLGSGDKHEKPKSAWAKKATDEDAGDTPPSAGGEQPRRPAKRQPASQTTGPNQTKPRPARSPEGGGPQGRGGDQGRPERAAGVGQNKLFLFSAGKRRQAHTERCTAAAMTSHPSGKITTEKQAPKEGC